MVKIIGTVVATVLSAFLYRLGGLSKEDAKKYLPWVPSWMVNTKARDIGCALISFAWMILFFLKVPWYIHFISFGLMFATLTTYWDSLFGYDNFYFHGFMIGLAYLPYAIQAAVIGEQVWLGYGLRCAALAVFMGIWCKVFENDWVEELGRGAAIAASLPLFLI